MNPFNNRHCLNPIRFTAFVLAALLVAGCKTTQRIELTFGDNPNIQSRLGHVAEYWFSSINNMKQEPPAAYFILATYNAELTLNKIDGLPFVISRVDGRDSSYFQRNPKDIKSTVDRIYKCRIRVPAGKHKLTFGYEGPSSTAVGYQSVVINGMAGKTYIAKANRGKLNGKDRWSPTIEELQPGESSIQNKQP